MNLLFHFILNKMAVDLMKKVAMFFISSEVSVGNTFSINISSQLQHSDSNI